MTTEEKAKAYDEALERAKELLLGNEHSNTIRSYFEHIFPQLRESEDERIRKRIYGLIYHNDALLDKDNLLAWLEKQKELDKMIVVSPEVWDNAISDAFENGKKEGEKQKEQNPNIELIQRSWYMEGYHDREFGKEPMWIIKTGEDGPKYEPNPKYGKNLSFRPSDEQMKGLKFFLDFHRSQRNAGTTNWQEYDAVESLYKQLKNL